MDNTTNFIYESLPKFDTSAVMTRMTYTSDGDDDIIVM